MATEQDHREGSQLIGYVRVSTSRQKTDQQRDALAKMGVQPEHIFEDKMSGARADRPDLLRMLAYLRAGDTVVVWRLDRLGRSMIQVLQTIEELDKRGVRVQSVHDNIDSSTSTGRLMIRMLASLAEYERELINERAAAAREAARARGEHVGRPKALTDEQVRQIRELKASGTTSVPKLAASFKVSQATVYRVLADQQVSA
jgi:DNA invertase Pin-like site-specific DNA recombinase